MVAAGPPVQVDVIEQCRHVVVSLVVNPHEGVVWRREVHVHSAGGGARHTACAVVRIHPHLVGVVMLEKQVAQLVRLLVLVARNVRLDMHAGQTKMERRIMRG